VRNGNTKTLHFNPVGRGDKFSGDKTMKTQPQPRPTVKAILDEQVTLSVECLDRLYLNGHEWAKCQLEKEGIAFEALDNGF